MQIVPERDGSRFAAHANRDRDLIVAGATRRGGLEVEIRLKGNEIVSIHFVR